MLNLELRCDLTWQGSFDSSKVTPASLSAKDSLSGSAKFPFSHIVKTKRQLDTTLTSIGKRKKIY